MTPAQKILKRWGGDPIKLAQDIGCARTIWHVWNARGGDIPMPSAKKIRAAAEKMGIYIKPSDFFHDEQ